MATKETEEKKEMKRRRPVCVLCVPVCNNMAAMRFFGSIHGTPETFAAAIGLAPESIDDRRDPAGAIAAVAKIVVSKTADEWRPVFAKADSCVTIMASLEEALRDPHFVDRGLFAHKLAGPTGQTMPALPVPIAPQFRDGAGSVKPVPTLGG